MKALYIAFESLQEFSGISKKILYQKQALERLGIDIALCRYVVDKNNNTTLMVDDHVVEMFGKGWMAKIRQKIKFDSLVDFIIKHDIKVVYIRYSYFATPCFVSFLKRIKKNEIRSFLEIPTYPYDQEHENPSLKVRFSLFIEKYYRVKMAKYLYRIITVSDHDSIFGVKTIQISNGIDFNNIKIKTNLGCQNNVLHLIGVAGISLWHGFDRLISGLAEYYKENPEVIVYFDLVGGGHNDVIKELMKQVDDLKLSEYVVFHGPKFGKDLDILFNQADVAIGSLACHRKGLMKARSLKNREYAARGIPFIYSDIDDDFENKPYILKVPADDSIINIKKIIDFYLGLSMSPAEIRDSVSEKLSWDAQMQKVKEQI